MALENYVKNSYMNLLPRPAHWKRQGYNPNVVSVNLEPQVTCVALPRHLSKKLWYLFILSLLYLRKYSLTRGLQKLSSSISLFLLILR